jgi:hypothetical protein
MNFLGKRHRRGNLLAALARQSLGKWITEHRIRPFGFPGPIHRYPARRIRDVVNWRFGEIHTTNVNRRCDNVDIRLMKPRRIKPVTRQWSRGELSPALAKPEIEVTLSNASTGDPAILRLRQALRNFEGYRLRQDTLLWFDPIGRPGCCSPS